MMTKRGTLGVGSVVLLLVYLLSAGAVAAAPNITCGTISGTYAFRMVPVKSFAADVLTDGADPSGILTAPRQDILRVGVFTVPSSSGSNCSASGNTIATTDTNAGETLVINFSWTGSITVNPNGTGTMRINPSDDEVINACTNTTTSPPTPGIGGCEDFEGPETYAFVFSSIGGKHLELIQTDNVGGGAKIFMTGRAEKQ